MKSAKKKSSDSWRPFEEAREFVHSLGLLSSTAWREWAKSDARPDDIPANPRSVYSRKGWMSFGDWLGTGRIATYYMVYRPFEEAREFVHRLGFRTFA